MPLHRGFYKLPNSMRGRSRRLPWVTVRDQTGALSRLRLDLDPSTQLL
jgi:hypothetical protein